MAKLTRDQVISICGSLEDGRIASIIATGADASELMEARTWIASDDYLSEELGHPPRGKVAQLVDILRADDQEWEDL